MRRHFRYDRNKTHPVWHDETCTDCGAIFQELSDPAASLHLCRDCFHRRLGRTNVPEPVQKLVHDDDWWTNFVYEDELKQQLLKRSVPNGNA